MKQCKVLSVLFAAAVLFISAAVNLAHGQASPTRTVPSMPSLQDWNLQDENSQDDVLTAIGPNVNVTHEKGSQSETSVAVDPTDDSHILMSVNDFNTLPERPNASTTVYESNDAGATFHSAHFHDLGFCADGWIAFNAAGTAFVAYECQDKMTGTFTQRLAYRIGQNPWTYMTFDPNLAGVQPDRDMVSIDTSSASPFKNSVYIGYEDAGSNTAPYVLYSRNGAQNWHRSALPIGHSSVGVNVSIAVDGTVYATWEDYLAGEILVVNSTDGGVSWGAPYVVTQYRMKTQQNGNIWWVLIPPQNVRGILPMPFSAVSPMGSPHAGRLYIAYTDLDPILDGSTSIYVRYSDNGTTWSNEAKVNDDTVHAYHFHPAIAVSNDGLVGVSFYDTRRDAQQKATDQFISFSFDGTTWTANSQVTVLQSDESGRDQICQPRDESKGACWQYGDYQGLAVDSLGTFRLSWTGFLGPPFLSEDDMWGSYVIP